MAKTPIDKKPIPVLAGIGLSLVAGGALIGATFIGETPANAKGSAGTYTLNALPDNYGTSDLFSKDQKGGTRQAQDSYYCDYYSYYGCCYYTDDGDYCCYYYGYYYCYDDPSKKSNNFIESGGFAAIRQPNTPLKKPVNVGGFTEIEKEALAGVMALDSGGFSGSGKTTGAPPYNNTFL